MLKNMERRTSPQLVISFLRGCMISDHSEVGRGGSRLGGVNASPPREGDPKPTSTASDLRNSINQQFGFLGSLRAITSFIPFPDEMSEELTAISAVSIASNAIYSMPHWNPRGHGTSTRS
jgi:hypothetical protein